MTLPPRALLGAWLAVALLSPSPVTAQQPLSPADAHRVAQIARIRQSVVQLRIERPAPAAGKRAAADADFDKALRQLFEPAGRRPETGSGFVVDAGRGLVLTAAHLAAPAARLTLVLPDGGERPARVASIDTRRGVAVLAFDGASPPALPVSARRALPGESGVIVGWLGTLGAPMALSAMVMGDAPAKAVEVYLPPAAVDYVALDVALPDGGFGGAPVVDGSGAVVGLVAAIARSGYGAGSFSLMIPGDSLTASVAAAASR